MSLQEKREKDACRLQPGLTRVSCTWLFSAKREEAKDLQASVKQTIAHLLGKSKTFRQIPVFRITFSVQEIEAEGLKSTPSQKTKGIKRTGIKELVSVGGWEMCFTELIVQIGKLSQGLQLRVESGGLESQMAASVYTEQTVLVGLPLRARAWERERI